ncbi:MAG: SgcJ/EcaC family oxidoreductase [Armatimonadetes bacterium]|nr:SgcJ/EcaC family oxidoreductase [Armatimonadota bacterium]
MNPELSHEDSQTIKDIVAQMEAAWNAADGQGFARDFADDADFVTVRAEHHKGKTGIGMGHQAIFDSIYKGSTNRYELLTARALTPDIALAHVGSRLECPSGPLAGSNEALFSLVLQRLPEGWKIAALHNTLAPRH